MSTTFNIQSTSDIYYTTDELATEGLQKYHLRSGNYTEMISTDEYGLGYSPTQNNPIVANNIIFYGDQYYKSITFDIGCLLYPHISGWGNTESFFVAEKIYFHGSMTSEMYVYSDGKYYHDGQYHDIQGCNGETIHAGQIPDIDRSAGLFFKAYSESYIPLGGNIHNSVLTYSQIRNWFDLEYRTDHPVWFRYLSDHYRSGGYWPGNGSNQAFNIYYKSTSGEMKLADAYIDRSFPYWGILAYTGKCLVIPFLSSDEYNAAYAATYKWNDNVIQQINQYVN